MKGDFMNYHKHIFNQKTLNRVLSRIRDPSVPNLKEKQEIISKWVQSLRSGKLGNIKETSIDQKFLDDFFVSVLGYQGVIGDSEAWNMIPQQKMKVTTNRADGALGYFSNEQEDIRAVIELKDAHTDLDSPQHRRNDKRTPVQQAFGYDPEAGKSCKWVIVSNFKELRLYHHSSSNEYEVFSIEKLLEPETFKKFYYLLSKENLIAKDGESEIEKLYRNNTEEEEQISTKFYGQYKAARIHLFEHLKKNNPEKDEMLLLEKTQKILDRFIFVCFCEDKGLLPTRIFRGTLEQARNVIIELEDKNWTFIQALFKAINDGKPEHDINKFNGGLFAPDDELDTLKLTDAVFEELAKITDYDFDTDLNVNILGHIFEQSISDLEEIKAEINGERLDKKKGKRKKEGIYYTPEYITRYIVENAIGGWLEDRKKELGFYDLPELTGKDYESVKVKKRAYNDNIKRHLDFWEGYKSILENIKVLDPACGSGAFLNQAFDYLYREGQRVNEEIAKLKRGTHSLVDLDKSILSDNLYGVDLNSESVEITKLSLWLKTASKHKELTALDENVKCGNSLIDDSEIAGEKAFKWEAEFSGIMRNGGFDVVIGNPPYVFAREKISQIEKDYFSKKYDSSEYQVNTFVLFTEKAIKAIKSNGMLGFIIPNSILKISSISKLRKIMIDKGSIETIVQLFGYSFENVNVETVVIIYKKGVALTEKVNVLNVNNEVDLLESNYRKIATLKWRDDKEFRFLVDIDEKTEAFIEKLRTNSIKLEEKFDVKAGLQAYEAGKGTPKQTSEDVKNRPYDFDYKFDENTHEYLEGKDVVRFDIKWSGTWLRYGGFLAAPRKFNIFSVPRILIREITAHHPRSLICTYVEQIYLNNRSIINILSKNNSTAELKTLLLILNSSLVSYYFQKTTPKSERKMFPKLILKDLREFPIKLPDNPQPFIEKADQMIDLNKQFHQTQNEFLDWLKIQYGLEKQSKKLESFYELDEEAFFVELKKKLPKENKNLSPKQTGEIKQYFEDYRQKIIALKNEIEKTDSEIDGMVYELYGLTKEEVEIVRR